MTDLSNSIAKVEGEHAIALKWFRDHKGKTVRWSEIVDQVHKGARLVTQAKGIYKPQYTDYALSVRQTLDSPYADKDVIWRSDGSWVYPYFQENQAPGDRDRAATNRGLLKCMEEGVPVGVLLQVKPKPGVEYLVLGLAAVTDWENGYFILEGFSDQDALRATKKKPDAAHDRARAGLFPLNSADFDPEYEVDLRERRIAEVIRRGGQAKFRASLIAAYGGKCAVTGCDAIEALEAAHILPHLGAHTDHPQNGLLLRADIHSLFDLGLLSIDPSGMTVVIAMQLWKTSYAVMAGRLVSIPAHPSLRPSAEALRKHLEWTAIMSSPISNIKSGTGGFT